MNKVDIREVLSVAEKIRRYGHKDGDNYILDGITLVSDFDGYNIQLKDQYVTLNVFFHNTFQIDTDNSRRQEEFLEKAKKELKMGIGTINHLFGLLAKHHTRNPLTR